MKVGDLIRDHRFPEDGTAIIVYIGDRRQRLCYKLYCTDTGNVDWFPKDYVEHQCIVINK
jgi:hypothetical protein